MPFNFNGSRRDKFSKAKYRVTNCAEYNEALRQRGAQQRYSDLAIELCLTLRVVFDLPLRQTQGFVRSLLQLMELELAEYVQDELAGFLRSQEVETSLR